MIQPAATKVLVIGYVWPELADSFALTTSLLSQRKADKTAYQHAKKNPSGLAITGVLFCAGFAGYRRWCLSARNSLVWQQIKKRSGLR
ncbi:hypothetical protein ATI02_1755 [Pseudomonas baetica]|uniref:Uncharacterized protein n=1 Tax=Pseudomonas baetica TaxID=674054 RepID=A0ABX4PV87_9PSED|nr:hypothetical protein ATI02_1755 [Pseudomonas baetica]